MMKKILIFLCLMFAFYLSHSQSINITSGYADGTFTKGKKVYILANGDPTGYVFDKWTGNVKVADSFSVSTSFTMPSTNVKLTATYKTAPVLTPVITTINGSTVYYYFPSGTIKGLITFYHGSGGSADNWFTDEFEKVFLQYAVNEGYGVFATESKDRANKVWDISGPGSVDVQNMSVMFSTLISNGLITSSTPIFGVGMSDGSVFCSMIAALDNFSANALYCESGDNQYIKTTKSPTEWCISNEDTTIVADMMSEAQSNYQLLKGRGIATQFLTHYATPVFPNIFCQQQSFDSVMSRTVYNELKAGGVLNSNDFITVDPLKMSTWKSLVDKSFSSKINYIQGELTAAAAEHRFHNYFEHKTIKFFDNHLAKIPAVLQAPLPSNDNTLSVYPDPANSYFNLQSTSVITTISVFNSGGKQVKQFLPNSAIGQFPSADLPNGVYYLQLTDANGKINYRKLLVNH